MLDSNLIASVLLPPASAARLTIVTGYASPAMGFHHRSLLEQVGASSIDVSVCLGMAVAEGVAQSSHRGFRRLSVETRGRHTFSYTASGEPVHAKLYVWLDSNATPLSAFVGSANYSQTAFFDGGTFELMESVSDLDFAAEYFRAVEERTISCLDENVDSRVQIFADAGQRRRRASARDNLVPPDVPPPVPEPGEHEAVSLSLLARTGEIHTRSGLNWGQREGRNPDQAYIPVPRAIAQRGFFPPRGTHFTLIADDGFVTDCVIAQDGDKAIESSQSNAELGLYFRERIGVPPGQFLHTEDLLAYGRTDVEIHRIDDETFFMDFSAEE